MDEYQGYFADCYVLTDQRTESFIEGFLDRFIPERRESADEYEVPQFSDNPDYVFKNARETIEFLAKNETIKYGLYWENPVKSDLRGVELFFTDDAHLIIGIYSETKYPNTEVEVDILEQMKCFCESDEGYITYEENPPLNSIEFREKIKSTKT